MKFQAPDEKQFTDTLQTIIGPAAEAMACDAADTSSLSHTAIYIDDEGEKVATCSCALPTAAALGCALSMIPPGGAEGMVEDKELSGMANDNLYEVMNILSALLMSDSTSHLKLDTVEKGGDVRFDGEGESAFKLELGAYGKGELVFNFS
ncbi:MAG: hypothetical protein KTR32_15525 [Granulosicoccus sp.]|nr:hypothetical protein [Granulosicoccus sp.]